MTGTPMDSPQGRTMVVAPTYQERDNIETFLRAVRAAVPQAQIVIVDDASPDGTAAAARELGGELGGITVLERPGKAGLGSAYRFGFAHAMQHGADRVVSIDVDASHDPAVIPLMLQRIDAGADVVIGSRYVAGGATVNWPWHRRMLSRWGNRYTAVWLGVHVKDCTSGFRVYHADTLAALEVGSTTAEGYAFLTELVRRLARLDRQVAEVPITFVDRQVGTSKMSWRIVVESMWLVTTWGVRDRWRRLRSQR